MCVCACTRMCVGVCVCASVCACVKDPRNSLPTDDAIEIVVITLHYTYYLSFYGTACMPVCLSVSLSLIRSHIFG